MRLSFCKKTIYFQYFQFFPATFSRKVIHAMRICTFLLSLISLQRSTFNIYIHTYRSLCIFIYIFHLIYSITASAKKIRLIECKRQPTLYPRVRRTLSSAHLPPPKFTRPARHSSILCGWLEV